MVKTKWFGDKKKAQMNKAMEITIVRAGNIVEATQVSLVPVDTGNLRSSISQTYPDPLTVNVGTPVEYAPDVEFPTRYTSAQPFVRPSLNDNKEKIISIAKKEGEKAVAR